MCVILHQNQTNHHFTTAVLNSWSKVFIYNKRPHRCFKDLKVFENLKVCTDSIPENSKHEHLENLNRDLERCLQNLSGTKENVKNKRESVGQRLNSKSSKKDQQENFSFLMFKHKNVFVY